jgi:cytosine/creatinine deaminase
MAASRPGVVGEPAGPAALAGTVPTALTGVRAADGSLVDVRLADGVVTSVAPAASAPAQPVADALDATGWRVLPAACEPHAHLDKALTAHRVAAGAGLDLAGAIESWRALALDIDTADLHARALAAVQRYVSRGITTVRTHVNLPDGPGPFVALDVMTALREQLAGAVRLQVCLLPGPLTSDAVLAEAVTRGPDVVGGCPHLAPDPRAETSRLLDLAERHGLPVDLHTDEQTGLGHGPHDAVDIVDLAHQVVARGLQQRVTASHCVRLGSLPPAELDAVLAAVARAGLGIVTLPITNLYLQGWDATHLVPRGIAPLRRILDAGIPLAAGADNLRDPFNPVGRADPFETTSLLVTAGHLRPEEALHAVTDGARAVLGLDPATPAPGSPADLVLVPDGDLGDVVAGAEDARVVLHAGRVVADTRVSRSLDLPVSTTPAPAREPALLHGR